MSAIDRYIVRTTLLAFLLIVVSLTGVIWITQALRGIDLMTGQGQSILVFLGVTGLAIPLLAMIISPIALLIAVMHTLNRLATDSEIIVMNAAGLSPGRLLRPFLFATCVVSLLVAFLSLYLAPECMRALRRWQTEIGADVLTNILRPGEFQKLGPLTIRIQGRQPGGLLVGIFIDDQRNPSERIDILADRGTVQKNERGSFLILQDGNLQRFETGKREPALVAFASYAFDLSQFSNAVQSVTYGPRERSMGDLISPPPDDPVFKRIPGEFRSELHDRIFAPIYPFVFVLMAFAILGAPRTTRQNRNFAIGVLVVGILVLRIAGFGLSTMSTSQPAAVFVQYFMLAAVSVGSVWMIMRGVIVDAPANLLGWINGLLSRRVSLRPQ
ncbi:lipopolysaccharide export system permease protein [Afipia massiliensis]|uniref:Lipopolysaccharide export system permease protein n=1 Tax=Afipia massiliensis TaxID=211460 RepID=A0A840N0H9_9BRAD|nr:LPS export ABC transporter permease LptF [Afipia massiliensis]MBB5051478.1 lipopolysaccharide export system permease protein [Afipia massiliensis]